MKALPLTAGALPAVASTTVRRVRAVRGITTAFWWVLSVGCFAGLWEAAWALGLADPLLLPPPHIFLAHFSDQAQAFSSSDVVGEVSTDGAYMALLTTIVASSLRVIAGLALGFTFSVGMGLLIRYFRPFGNLTLPTITLLAPISPIAWLPVAIFIFGIGNPPAIFMVFISLFFVMTLSTISQIDSVSRTYLNVGAIMGASRRQLFLHVIVPAILPSLFMTLRMNLFGAWMVVLVAEATGVGSGLGQIVMLARNTFNSSLTFFTMTLIGVVGFLFDVALRQVQNRVLFWVPPSAVGRL